MKNHPGAYRSVAAGCFVLIVLGGIYAFSTYVPTLISQWGFSPFQTQTTFGLTIFLFTLMMIPGGRKLPHWGPRRLILLAGALFMGSHFLASLAAGGFPLFLLSYLLLSCAMGLGYVSVVSCGVLWFPHRKGLVTGLTIGAMV